MYHDIKLTDFKKLENQIYTIKNDGWKFLHPKELMYFNRKKKIKGKNIILTFDDGFYSNLIVEKKILSKFKIKAAFFIPYNFMKSKNKKESLSFIRNKLKVNEYNPDNLNRVNMNLNDIIELNRRKHVIGYHTKNHIELSKCKSQKKIKEEIITIKNNKFKKIIFFNKYFSFPFGKLEDLSNFSCKLAKNNYNFTFLGIRGENKIHNLKQKVIFRDNFMTSYNKKMTLSILNGYFDFFYSKKRKAIFKIF